MFCYVLEKVKKHKYAFKDIVTYRIVEQLVSTPLDSGLQDRRHNLASQQDRFGARDYRVCSGHPRRLLTCAKELDKVPQDRPRNNADNVADTAGSESGGVDS